MAWEKFNEAAPTKAIYADSVKAFVNKRKDGSITLTITMNELMASNLAFRDKCDVYLGTDDDEGKVQLQFNPDAEIIVRKMAKGGVRLTLNAPRFCPKMDKPAEPCGIINKNEKQITFLLPLIAWGRAAKPTTPPIANGAGRSAITLTDPDKIDPLVYLGKQGYVVERRGISGYVISGERKNHSDIVAMINISRKKKDLPEVGLDDVIGG